MRIGIDGEELQGRATGTGRYLRNLLHVWAEEGHDELIVYVKRAESADSQQQLADLPGIQLRSVGHAGMGSLRWREGYLTPAVRRDRPQVFFSPAYVCPLRLSLPRVVAVHDISFFSVPHDFSLLDGLRRRILVGASLSACRAVLACSQFTRRELLALRPELLGRVFHVPLGRDDDLPPAPSREEARAALGLQGPLLLSVGSILNRRCLPELLHVVRRLRRRFPRLQLDVVGDNRTHPPLDLPGLLASLDLASAVRLSGFVSEADLARRYAAADVAIFLSEYEGFGLPALEAMARDLPVVTSFLPSLGEVFSDAALLVDPRDVSGVASTIEAVLRDTTLRDALRERGRRLASQLDWQTTARRTRQVLAEVAGS